MRDIIWSGDPAPKALAAALRARDVEVRRVRGPRGTTSPSERPLIVFTSRARRVPVVDSAHQHQPWIWLTKEWPGDERCREAVLAGAYDVVVWGRDDAAAQVLARLEELFVSEPPPPVADGLVTTCDASRRVLAQVARVAPTAMPVLLTGETGTGKEVLARLIHAWSPRRAKQFVPINCAAIPNELMEAELFGYARGAFSGAVQGYDGQLAAASGGTVFMDEIDDTPLATQVKLLRVLEDRIVSRLGENVWHQVDFRILAATNRDLRPLIEDGTFGNDLYERLAIVTIRLAPLRERVEDLPALARHFLARFAREHPQTGAARVKDIRADALRALQAYAWPGNIRELRNVIYETLVYKRAGEEILPADLPRRVLTRDPRATAAGVAPYGPAPLRSSLPSLSARGSMAGSRGGNVADAREAPASPLLDPRLVADRVSQGQFNLRDEVAALQRLALDEALRCAGGNATKAARLLGAVGRGRASDPGGTVRAMMRRFDLDAGRS